MRLALSSLVLVLGTLAGCAGRPAKANGNTRDPEPTIEPHLLRVRVEFQAEHRVFGRTAIPPGAEVPQGRSPVRRMRVCAYEKRARNDFASAEAEVNDRRLGCGTTDDDGMLEIPLAKDRCRPGMLCHRRLYLVTDLCAMHRGEAQVCVTVNTDQGRTVGATPWKKYAEFRKFMWSETYNVSLVDRTSTLLTWNMSCPGERGEGRDGFVCDRAEPEGRWGRSNSNYGYNKDAVHALQAGAQAVRRFGRLIPDGGTTLSPGGKFCGGPRDSHKRAFQCRDAMRLVIADSRRLLMEGDKHCERGRKGTDRSKAMRSACLMSPMNPFIVVHEMGHLAHIRWMNYRGPINTGKVGWDSGTAERSQIGEGWADFFAAAAWYGPDAEHPTFNGRDIENPKDSMLWSSCAGGKPVGEGRPAQFFWDLYDAPSPAEPADQVQLSMGTLLEIWSMFRGSHDADERADHSKGECGPHGRNVYDFLHYYQRYPNGVLPDPGPLLPLNCMSGQERGMKCSR